MVRGNGERRNCRGAPQPCPLVRQSGSGKSYCVLVWQEASPELNLSAKWDCFSLHHAKLLLNATAAAATETGGRSTYSTKVPWEFDVAYVYSASHSVWFQLRRETCVENEEVVSKHSKAQDLQLTTDMTEHGGNGYCNQISTDSNHDVQREQVLDGFMSTTSVSPRASPRMDAGLWSGNGAPTHTEEFTMSDSSHASSAPPRVLVCASSAQSSASVADGMHSNSIAVAPPVSQLPAGQAENRTSNSKIPSLQLELEPEPELQPELQPESGGLPCPAIQTLMRSDETSGLPTITGDSLQQVGRPIRYVFPL